jgi:hypothetical protein
VKFDKEGNYLGEFAVGPAGSNYYGFAYDQYSPGGPYLWGYAQTGNSDNEIIQIQLPSGNETGFTLDVTEKLSGQVWGDAGGLFTHPNLVFGKWTLGGLVQNERIWGLELSDAQTWLGVFPNGGSLNPGESVDLTVVFDATGMEGGIYDAEVLFTTWPNVGSPVLDITMVVNSSLFFPCNLQSEIVCTDVALSWEMCPAGGPMPESFNIYRNDSLLANVTDSSYTDYLLVPEAAYGYKVSAVISGEETVTTPEQEVTIALPDDLEPSNLTYTVNGNIFTFTWDPPQGCLTPDGYNIYKDGIFIDFTTEPEYQLQFGGFELFVTAVYYFGESGPSNSIVITYTADNIAGELIIYPNPASKKLFIQSQELIDRIDLFDNTGGIFLSKKVKNTSVQLNVSQLESGIYIVKVDTDLRSIIRKIIIE